MTRCVVLVRGINVGGAKKLAMADLARVLGGLDLTDVRTVLNSGNAVFTTGGDPEPLVPKVEAALQSQLGVRASCLVRTAAEVAAVLAADPFTELTAGVDKAGSRMTYLFTEADPTPTQLADDDPRALDPGRIALGPRVVYQWCPDGVLAAPDVSRLVLRRWGLAVTGRNRNTVEKLATLLAT